ncbi:hypothetical protein DY000_02047613 [Brassica cretica]|uniref:Ubiquitin-like protease family profile domain-containing protein n=1 Tax=Brassica cretica TaxID=69181 RepID=A0ABQ7F0K3_BRACR|nr:hypothetical protein DY000_02047613 [Brassica cretica]
MRLVKKHKEKEPCEKVEKDKVAEMTEGASSDTVEHNAIALLVSSQISDNFMRSTQAMEEKIATVVLDNLKIMESAIIKVIETLGNPKPTGGSMEGTTGVNLTKELPPSEPDLNNNTPAEVADSRINKVLMDLNGLSDVHLGVKKQLDIGVALNISNLEPVCHEEPAAEDAPPGSITIAPPSRLSEEQQDNSLAPNTSDLERRQPRVAIPALFCHGLLLSNLLEIPSFSLGLLREEEPAAIAVPNPINYVLLPQPSEDDLPVTRKSKRPRVMPAAFHDYKCDPKVVAGQSLFPNLDHRFLLFEEKVHKEPYLILRNGYQITPSEICDIAYRRNLLPNGVMDALMGFLSRSSSNGEKVESERQHDGEDMFPFNMDKQHWVGVCIDTQASTLYVIDCNTSLRTDRSMKKELSSIVNLILYVLKTTGYYGGNADLKAFLISRCKGISQITCQTDALVMTVLLVEAQVSGGLDGCKALTTRLLPEAVKQLGLRFYAELTE